MYKVYSIVIAFSALTCHAADTIIDSPVYPITINKIHDGDTFDVDIDLGFGLRLESQTIRAADCDTWEITRTRKTVTITDAELAKGREARDAAAKLFAEHETYMQSQKPLRDNYGRILGHVYYRDATGTLIPYGKWVRDNGYQRQ